MTFAKGASNPFFTHPIRKDRDVIRVAIAAIIVLGQTLADIAESSETGGSISVNDIIPDFSEAIENVTVPVGREAILSCSVTDLGNFKVGWLKAEDQTILTLHTKVVTHNSRISVTHDGSKTWRLHIRQIKETDRGCYMCQINTSRMKKQVGCVDVHVPPDIIDVDTSSDLNIKEEQNATLVCRAKGRPTPRIVWRREDGEPIEIRSGPRDILKVDTVSGEVLQLKKVSRAQMAAYLCIASNDVPPAVSKRVILSVNFAPTIKVPNQLLGAPTGTDVILECHIEAFPNTINYWMRNRHEMLLNGNKHIITEERHFYKVCLKLKILNFKTEDVGTYMCVATNSLGRADGIVRLYEIQIATKPPTTTTTTTTETPIVTKEFITTTIRSTLRPYESKGMLKLVPTTIGPLESLREEQSFRGSVEGQRRPTLQKQLEEMVGMGINSGTLPSSNATSIITPTLLLLLIKVFHAIVILLLSCSWTTQFCVRYL